MKNFVQPGNRISLTAPAGGVVSGTMYLIGSIIVVALTDAAAGATFQGYCGSGVLQCVKATGQAWTEGMVLYWDNTAKNVTNVVGTNTKIGFANRAAAAGDVIGFVNLNGTV